MKQNEQPNLKDEDFWDTLKRYATKIGREIVENALALYYALQDPDTPVWAKSIIIGALLYFVSPLDAIPDTIPVVGFSDDAGVLIAALAAVAVHIKPEHKEQAAKRATEWFG
ncbi:MAG: DUF1232 domain-containing protein [Verrucomicrobiaceae bacterium]|nr:DUF1232 domain-containing protein [Verrucomicrobiaceae bacterium]